MRFLVLIWIDLRCIRCFQLVEWDIGVVVVLLNNDKRGKLWEMVMVMVIEGD